MLHNSAVQVCEQLDNRLSGKHLFKLKTWDDINFSQEKRFMSTSQIINFTRRFPENRSSNRSKFFYELHYDAHIYIKTKIIWQDTRPIRCSVTNGTPLCALLPGLPLPCCWPRPPVTQSGGPMHSTLPWHSTRHDSRVRGAPVHWQTGSIMALKTLQTLSWIGVILFGVNNSVVRGSDRKYS